MAQKTPPIGGASAVEPAERTRATSPAEAAESVERVEKTAAASEVRAPSAIDRVAATGAVDKVAPTRAADQVRGIADRLRRGVITPSQAVEELIEDAVHKNLPGLPADSPLVEELRALLTTYAQDDPHLLQQVKRLGAG